MKPRLKHLALLILAFTIAFRFKHLFLVALVNNRPITRLSLDQELEKNFGQQVLEGQITRILILQAAKKSKIEVLAKEIDEKISKLESQFKDQGMDLESLLEAQGQSRQELGEQIKLQLLVEKILEKDIKVTEEEVKKYYEENKETLPQDTSFEQIKEDLSEQLRQQKIGEKFQPWLTQLREEARIYYFLRL